MHSGKVFLWIIFLSGPAAAALPPDIAGDVQQAQRLQSLGQFSEAERILQQAIRRADELPDGVEAQVAALSSLASVEIELARLDEAARLYDRGLRILIRQFGEKDSRVQRQRVSIAELYLESGQIEEARKLLRVAIKYQEALAEPADRALALDVLACVEGHRNKFEAAESAEREALSIYETLGSERQADFAIALSHMASFLDRQRPVEALSLAQRALALLGTLTVPQPAIEAESEITLASIYARLHRADEAAAASEAGRRIAERLYGPDHLRTAEVLLAQAAIFRSIGRKQEARQAQRQGDAILARAGNRRPIAAVAVEALLP